jgi:hypothetical protein
VIQDYELMRKLRGRKEEAEARGIRHEATGYEGNSQTMGPLKMARP